MLRRRTVVGRVLGTDRVGSATLAGDRGGRAGAVRAFGRVHAAGVRGDPATVAGTAAAAAAVDVDTDGRTVPERRLVTGPTSPSAPSPAAAAAVAPSAPSASATAPSS